MKRSWTTLAILCAIAAVGLALAYAAIRLAIVSGDDIRELVIRVVPHDVGKGKTRLWAQAPDLPMY